MPANWYMAEGGSPLKRRNVRLQHLTPIPGGRSLDAIAAELLEHLGVCRSPGRRITK